jgi:release factor glutamine methyltransferase
LETPSGFTVADVGAGSGAIAVTLAKERPGLKVIAIEQSSVAMHFARRYAAAHGCEIRFLQGDLLAGFAPESLDAVVTNPPYLNPAQAATWPRELAWEPWLALDGGQEGIEITAKLIRQAGRVLKPSGWLALEIGMDQAGGVRRLAEQNGFRVDRIIQDLAGLDRVAILWKN